MNSKWITRGLPILVLLYLSTSPVCAQQYVMTLLGFAPFSQTISGANGLDNNGDVVGFDAAINGAFLYHGGVVSSLGLPFSVGVAIDNNGYIALRSWGPDLHSYLYTPGRLPHFISHFTDIGTLGGSGGLNNTGQSVALDMNDSRTIVGLSTVSTTKSSTPPWHAFSWTNGQMTDLDLLPDRMSSANAINNMGEIVGDCVGPDGYVRAFQVVNGGMADLDPVYRTYDSYAVAVNDAGQIVVQTDLAWRFQYVSRGVWQIVAYRGPTYYTVVYTGGVPTSIDNLPSMVEIDGNSINNAGDVVGIAIDASSKGHAFLYRAGTLVDLNDRVTNRAGWRIQNATLINDMGQIVCWVKDDTTGERQTAVLTPILD